MDDDTTSQAHALKVSIEIIHEIDRIRDATDDLREALRDVLKLLVRTLHAHTAFVRYFDPYEEPCTIAIDSHGIIKRELIPTIDTLVPLALDDPAGIVVPDPRILGTDGHYLAIAMSVRDTRVGVLGIGKQVALDDNDRCVCQEAAQMLDTMIYSRNEHQAQADKVEVMGEVDRMLDANAYDLDHCLGDIVEYLIHKLHAVTMYLFAPGEDEFRIVRTNDLGKTIWDNYEQVRYAIMERIQEARYGDLCRSAVYHEPDAMSVASTTIRCIVSNPLSTSGGETAGTFVLLFTKPANTRTLDLVRAASSLIDSALIAEKRAQFMVQRFNKYVGSHIMAMLLKNPEWLNPRQEQIALISVDLVGSTAFSTRTQDAFVFFQNINQYLGLIASVIRNEYHGTLDKYIGDEVIGIFGAPIRDANCGMTAVTCALDILKRITSFNASRETEKRPCFDVKITVGLVAAIIGEVGSLETVTDYTTMGAEVNAFYRICRHAAPGMVVVNRALAENVDKCFESRLLMRAALKGIEEETEIYEIVGRR